MLFAAYGGHTTSNPKYIAAVKAQQEKERQRPLLEGQKIILRMRAEKAEQNRAVEERWHREFQYAISALRCQHLASLAEKHTAELLSMFRTVDARATPEPTPPKLVGRTTAEHIIRVGVYGTPFTVGDIKGPRRSRQLVEIRHQLMAKVYVECPWLSLPQIGKAFGGRDHTSAYFAVKKMGVHHSQPGGARKDDFARAA